VVTREDFSAQSWSLSIPLYVKRPTTNAAHANGTQPTLAKTWETWETSGRMFWEQMDTVVDMLDGLVGPEEQADV
jgi:type I restriction enzyme M protein